jgi:hypothetical protein
MTWQPRFFVAAGAGTDDPNEWQFNGRYWAMRDARLAASTFASFLVVFIY